MVETGWLFGKSSVTLKMVKVQNPLGGGCSAATPTQSQQVLPLEAGMYNKPHITRNESNVNNFVHITEISQEFLYNSKTNRVRYVTYKSSMWGEAETKSNQIGGEGIDCLCLIKPFSSHCIFLVEKRLEVMKGNIHYIHS